ncbi:LOW QUALITY PROTEIN: D-alanyl-lipoteichoic acid acyltransferase DltB (MBOAT superfamily) [Flavobacteriaceae bacterium MAR_2009_75]|nr:LOW QUALITY PROTEIN: D-alanyl-lipoteichoic acid acyltransferase DltB (MBOAT superfamily) [Flavobacteriaceae bacterium MAR_2009_75]
MLFNSIEFLLFLPTVFLLYWFFFAGSLRLQNVLILVSSYVFYGWWDYRFLLLIFLSTIVDYIIGQSIDSAESKASRRSLLYVSMIFNLGVLGFFKYFNFFIDSWVELLDSFGYKVENTFTLQIILPVGISFYTFQTMSYTIDVYRRNLKPTKDFISFASFVSFFPQLVAGPIERATNLLPQILSKRQFYSDIAIQGLRLIVWGMFKKVVIADSLAPVVDNIFSNYQDFDGGTLFFGAIFFAFQIYCDFSGYSDIAIGVSKLFGFELMSNFKFPYFSRDIGEFWRRWHISLSTWFRDYLYIPLGGSRGGEWVSLRNIFVIFLVSGFWHGANWTFIIWGLIHALLYVPSFILSTNRRFVSSVVAEKNNIPSVRELWQMGSNFFFVTLAWVFFRSESTVMAWDYLKRIFLDFSYHISFKDYLFFYILPFVIVEWFLRKDERLSNVNKFVWLVLTLVFLVLIFAKFGTQQSFIYFQF